MTPVRSADAMGSQDIEAAWCSATTGKCARNTRGSILPGRREVIMTISEYEERFRFPAPSLHQTFAMTRGSNRGRRRTRRLWVAAAVVGVMTMTCKVASHYTSRIERVIVGKYGCLMAANSLPVTNKRLHQCD